MTDPRQSIHAADAQVEPPASGSTDAAQSPAGAGSPAGTESAAGEAPGAAARLRSLSSRFDRYKRTSGLVLALIITCAIFTVESSYFLTVENFYNILLQAANLAIDRDADIPRSVIDGLAQMKDDTVRLVECANEYSYVNAKNFL